MDKDGGGRNEGNSFLGYGVMRSLGWLLEEIHVTWAHLEKKQTRLRLFIKSIEEYAYIQIFYDRIDHTLKQIVDYAVEGRLRKLGAEKVWVTIEELARYEDEGWNDLVSPGEGSLDYENPDIEQLLGVMKCKVNTLMKEAISLMGRSESVFGMTSNTVYQLPSEPSRQEEFEDLVINFILNQEEKVRQLEEYISVIGNDFMQLSLEVVRKLRKEIRIEQNRSKKIKKIMMCFKSFKFIRLKIPDNYMETHG
ncbi:hypothetical protein Tco_1437695 [Tanacetum coccineum]